jgi:fumarate hydratase subunit alpha
MSARREFVEGVVDLMRVAATRLPVDAHEALRRAAEREGNELARKQLEAILRNAELAGGLARPICQDTGMVYFFARAGRDFPLLLELEDALREATREATRRIPLRPNAVDPMRDRNSGDNTGSHMPWVDLELTEGDGLLLTVLFKGGGSEYPSVSRVIPPIQGLNGVKRFVVESMFNAGAMPCPPVVIGVGIAGGVDVASKLAKRSLLRPIGERHPEPEVARLEEEILGLVNRLEIGPHGFGGPTTALDVKVEYGHRHPASLAVAFTTNCWAVRRGTAEFKADGSHRIVSRHMGVRRWPSAASGCRSRSRRPGLWPSATCCT